MRGNFALGRKISGRSVAAGGKVLVERQVSSLGHILC